MSQSPVFPTYLSVCQVSEILGVKEKFIYSHQVEIPGYLKVAGKILFDADVLFKELKKRTYAVGTFPTK